MTDHMDITVDGVRLACTVRGPEHAPPVVMLHGLGGSASTWDTVASALADAFLTIAVNLRGHGGSDHPGRYSFELMRDDVLGLLDQLGLGKVMLVGHSMGGAVAYLIAERAPGRVSRLVLEETPPPVPLNRGDRSRPDGPLSYDWEVVPSILRQLNDPDPDWWGRLSEITAPTLVIAGGPDSQLPQDKIKEAAARIPGACVVTIPVGHQVHSASPEDFTTTVREFLNHAG
jgi:3-oxoadipate enol-lactonase